jgi:hypothetical protein
MSLRLPRRASGEISTQRYEGTKFLSEKSSLRLRGENGLPLLAIEVKWRGEGESFMDD